METLLKADKPTYLVETYGCQMNAHDSERITGLLDQAGYSPVSEGADPDLVVFNTCAVREAADERLYGSTFNVVQTDA